LPQHARTPKRLLIEDASLDLKEPHMNLNVTIWRALSLNLLMLAGVSMNGEVPTGNSLPTELRPSEAGAAAPWIPAENAFTLDGKPRNALITPDTARLLDWLSKAPIRDGCTQAGPVFIDRAWATPATLAGAISEARVVLLLKVVDRTHGFFMGIPGQLMHLTVEALLKGQSGGVTDYYLLYPVAQFDSGPFRVCKSDERYAAPPNPGDRLIYLQWAAHPSGDPRFLGVPDPKDVIPVTAAGQLILPPSLRAVGSLGLLTVEDVRDRLSSGPAKK
jgi:hypothetical protein